MSNAETITGRAQGVLVPTATEAGWLAARRQGITASEISVIMGLAPESYGSPFALYHRKRGDLGEMEQTLSMRIGAHDEPLIADLFAEARPEFSVDGDGRSLYRHPGRPWQMATPDRLIYDTSRGPHWPHGGSSWEGFEPWGPPAAVMDCKKWGTYDGWGEAGSDDIPVHIRCQVLWQCDVLGVDSWFVAVLFTHADKFRVYEGVIDSAAERDLDLMRAAGLEFRARVLTGMPPAVDWRPATADALKALHPDLDDTETVIPLTLARRYRAACRAYKAAERRKKLAENQIRERAAASRYILAGGEPVATRQVYDVKEHVRRKSHVDKLVPAKQEGQQT